MKNLLWLLTACFLFGLPFAAEAQFPKPRPAAAPAVTAAPVQAPPVQAAPSEVASPPVVVAAPTTMDEIKSWLTVTFGGLIALFLGKIGFKPAAPTAAAPGAPAIPAGVTTVLSKLQDPNTLAGLEAMGLRIVQTGIPGMGIQTAAGVLNPAAGAAAVVLEPKVRQVVIDILKDLIDKRTQP